MMRSHRILSTIAYASAVLAQAPPQPAISISVQGATTAADPRIKDVIVGGFQPAAQLGGPPIPIRAFTPETLTAVPGDTIRFTFLGTNHSIMQTTADSPCQPLANGFTTGPMPNPNNDLNTAPKVGFQVPDAPGPIYMSTMAPENCGVGMVLTVNPPVEGQPGSHAQFKARAIQQGNPGLAGPAGLVVQAAAPQVASTVSIQVAGVGTPAAQPIGPPGTVVQGTGRTGNGQPCGCQCLCGGSVAAPAGVAQGNFGGVVGQMPAPQQPMSPAGMAPMAQLGRFVQRGFKPPLY